MTTYLRGSRFHYRFRLLGKDYSGVCPGCDLPLGATTRDAEAARKKAVAFEAQVRREAEDIRKNKTVAALVENYRYELTGGRPIPLGDVISLVKEKPWKKAASEAHWQHKESYWRDFALFMEGVFPDVKTLDAIRRSHCESYVSHLARKGRYCKEVSVEGAQTYVRDAALSGKTIGEIVGVCRSFCSKLAEDAGLTSNPWDGIVLPEKVETPREVFTPEELRRIGDGVSGERDRVRAAYQGADASFDQWRAFAEFCRPLFVIASMTGLSEGDICTLRRAEIDGKRHVIGRFRRKTRVWMEIPILPALSDYLRTLPGEDYVLPDHAAMYDGNPSGVSYRVKEFLHGVGIKTLAEIEGRRAVSVKDLHSMRHVFCHYARRAGIPMDRIAKIVGHKAVSMTEHYADHDSADDLRREIEKLPPVFGGSLEDYDARARRRLADLAYSLPIEKVMDLLSSAE